MREKSCEEDCVVEPRVKGGSKSLRRVSQENEGPLVSEWVRTHCAIHSHLMLIQGRMYKLMMLQYMKECNSGY